MCVCGVLGCPPPPHLHTCAPRVLLLSDLISSPHLLCVPACPLPDPHLPAPPASHTHAIAPTLSLPLPSTTFPHPFPMPHPPACVLTTYPSTSFCLPLILPAYYRGRQKRTGRWLWCCALPASLHIPFGTGRGRREDKGKGFCSVLRSFVRSFWRFYFCFVFAAGRTFGRRDSFCACTARLCLCFAFATPFVSIYLVTFLL